MKLYTEDQVYDAISKAFRYKSNIEILNSLTPIELPTDEEIEDKGKWVFNDAGHTIYTHYNTVPSWVAGAKWMRDKIQGGKE